MPICSSDFEITGKIQLFWNIVHFFSQVLLLSSYFLAANDIFNHNLETEAAKPNLNTSGKGTLDFDAFH